MGHLFIQGGKTRQDDGVRTLYVGTAIEISSNIFPDWLTYTALGHLHSPQKAGRENIRYSGSPAAMGFGEAGQNKAVYILELDGKTLTDIREINIPEFQRLERVDGDLTGIFSQLQGLSTQNESIWVEVTYTGNDIVTDLQDRLTAFTNEHENIEIISVRNEPKRSAINIDKISHSLENTSPLEMLSLCFDENNTSEEQRKVFIPMYQEILHQLGVSY